MLSAVVEGKFSYREVIEGQLKRAKNPKRIAELEAELAMPELPAALAYLWRLFHRLRRRKGGNGFGLSPIGWPDIDAFVRNARVRLAPWEIELIEDLDDLFLDSIAQPDIADPPNDPSRN